VTIQDEVNQAELTAAGVLGLLIFGVGAAAALRMDVLSGGIGLLSGATLGGVILGVVSRSRNAGLTPPKWTSVAFGAAFPLSWPLLALPPLAFGYFSGLFFGSSAAIVINRLREKRPFG
jgi:hypothetical protein